MTIGVDDFRRQLSVARQKEVHRFCNALPAFPVSVERLKVVFQFDDGHKAIAKIDTIPTSLGAMEYKRSQRAVRVVLLAVIALIFLAGTGAGILLRRLF